MALKRSKSGTVFLKNKKCQQNMGHNLQCHIILNIKYTFLCGKYGDGFGFESL